MSAIPTARGDTVDSGDLGVTLVTESIVGPVSPEVQMNWPDHTFGALSEQERIEEAVAQLVAAKAVGVDTMIDRTIPGIGRSVPLVKKIAERAPVNILVATGWYTWHDLPFYFMFREQSPERAPDSGPTLEDFLVRDIEEGVLDTGVRAAIIKVVTDRYGITDGVRVALRAGVGAHRRTGIPITTHTGLNLGIKTAALQLEFFERHGVDPTRVIFGHIDFTPPDVPLSEFEAILAKGSCISFDTLALASLFPPEFREKRIERVVELCSRGYASQLMLSNDNSCFVDIVPPSTFSPSFAPFTELALDFLPLLREHGVSDEQIEQMMVHNPRRLLESGALGGY